MSSGIGVKASPSMRDKMPLTTALIDDLRAVFGAAEVTSAIGRGLKTGEFWAIEAGHVVGNPPAEAMRRHNVKDADELLQRG
jgi:hypothetical protein